MELFDSHAHLTDEEIGDPKEVLELARAAGVTRIMDVGSNLEDSARCVRHAGEFAGVYAAVGIHPSDAPGFTPKALQVLDELTEHPNVVAIGEMGFDFHYGKDTKQQQRVCFEAQLQYATERRLPVIIHDRDAHGQTLELLKKYAPGLCGGILHCFSGSLEFALDCIDLGFYISFSGSVTFKNAKKLQEVARQIDLAHMLVETDSPYLSPEPLRGRWPNRPANVVHTAAKIAQLKGMQVEQVAKATFANALAVYGIRE